MKTNSWKGILIGAIAFAAILCCPSLVNAGPTIDPGETYEFMGAEGTIEEVSTCTENNHCFTDWTNSEVAIGTILVEGEAQEIMAKITAYNTFMVSEGDGRMVSAVLNGMVSWEGYLNVGAADEARAAVGISVELYDMTAAKTVASQTVHGDSCSSMAEEPCYAHNSGSGGINLSASLTRGHDYEIRLIAQCTSAFDATATNVICAYAPWSDGYGVDFGDGFVAWSNFELTIEPDTLEMIQDLRQDLDDLSMEVDQIRIDLDALTLEVQQLREEFENHTHIYLTGRGVGHNNTEAVTTTPASGTDGDDQSGGSDNGSNNSGNNGNGNGNNDQEKKEKKNWKRNTR